MIQGLTSDKWEMDPRADILLKSGFINEKELKAALESEKKNQARWYEILISKGKLQQTFLDKATQVVIRTTLLDVFQWGEGIYRFEDWDQNTEGFLTCNLPTEAVILDTLRSIDEWPLIKPKIPPVEYLPVTITPLTEDHVKTYDLSSVDMHIFDLIDGEKSVETIVRESLETPYDALHAFVKLIEAGLVEVFPRGVKDQRAASLAKVAFYRYLKVGAVYVSLILCISALLLVGKPRVLHLFNIPTLMEQFQHQRELAETYAKLGIAPSVLGKDMYDR